MRASAIRTILITESEPFRIIIRDRCSSRRKTHGQYECVDDRQQCRRRIIGSHFDAHIVNAFLRFPNFVNICTMWTINAQLKMSQLIDCYPSKICNKYLSCESFRRCTLSSLPVMPMKLYSNSQIERIHSLIYRENNFWIIFICSECIIVTTERGTQKKTPNE